MKIVEHPTVFAVPPDAIFMIWLMKMYGLKK